MSFLQPVKAIFSDYLTEEDKEYFFIPIYQRSYKWEKKHIVKLLNDVNNFQIDDDKFYCLQNITLIPKGNVFNVVDGQQRLTTLTLILSYLSHHNLVATKVQFPKNSIRENTNKFINDISGGTFSYGNIVETTWIELINEFPNLDHQDIFHLFNSYNYIANWFEKKLVDKDAFSEKLLNHVKLIINKIDEQENEERIFANLNSKRIPLDGSDLVRAMIITRVSNEQSKSDVDTKKIVRLNERRIKIGLELDLINIWWSQTDNATFFEKFIGIKSEDAGVNQKLFKETHPINLLYLLFAEKEGERSLTLDFIETYSNRTLELYSALSKLHETLQDWRSDRVIYHYLGFLFNNFSGKITFTKVWSWWVELNNRDAFIAKLKSKIKSELFGKNDIIIDSSVDWYNNEKDSLIKLLLLLDIIKSLNKNQPFLPVTAFSKTSNDVEHIFPQNPENISDKKQYIEYLNKNVITNDAEKFDFSEFSVKSNDEDYQLLMENFISAQIKNIKLNSLGNLVLLYSSLNRSLGRISYSKKRARVISHFNNGYFIQPHSFKVFIRDFNDEINNNNDLERWDNNDILANENNIISTITNFFIT